MSYLLAWAKVGDKSPHKAIIQDSYSEYDTLMLANFLTGVPSMVGVYVFKDYMHDKPFDDNKQIFKWITKDPDTVEAFGALVNK